MGCTVLSWRDAEILLPEQALHLGLYCTDLQEWVITEHAKPPRGYYLAHERVDEFESAVEYIFFLNRYRYWLVFIHIYIQATTSCF